MSQLRTRTSKAIALAGLVLFFCLFLVIKCPAQEEAITVSGSILLLDLTNRTMRIEYADENNATQIINLILSEYIELFGLASLEELNISDNVTVDYFIDEQDNLEAVYLYKFPPPTG